MINWRQAVLEVKRLMEFQGFVQAYSEIAAMRVQRLRQAVLGNRDFLSGLQEVYESLKLTYRREIADLLKRRDLKDSAGLSLFRRNGKTAYVWLAANTGLYGDLIRGTYDLFKKSAVGEGGDLVIIGRLGADIFREDYPRMSFAYFDFPDDKITPEGLGKLSRHLLNYEKVVVFYGRFETVAKQVPYFSGVSGEGLMPSRKKIVAAQYLFEPSLEKIIEFFESQIFTSLFVQTVHENLLAKFAARMFNLDAAAGRINDRLAAATMQQLRLKHREDNAEQLSSLAGLSLWEVGY